MTDDGDIWQTPEQAKRSQRRGDRLEQAMGEIERLTAEGIFETDDEGRAELEAILDDLSSSDLRRSEAGYADLVIFVQALERQHHDVAIKAARKATRALNESNVQRNGRPGEKRDRYDAAIRERLAHNPHLSVSEAKRRVATEFGTAEKTVKRNSSRAEAFKK